MHRNLRLRIIGEAIGHRTDFIALELRRLDGVMQVFVDAGTGAAHIHYNTDHLTEEAIARKLHELGYETGVWTEVEDADAVPAGGDSSQLLDAVCGAALVLHESTRLHRAAWDQHTYFFCSRGCHDAFLAAPDRYIESPGKRVEARWLEQ